jgi:ArsR family transcriptional regulator, arsenate/arsenite/antimonite-responsive transcriptional repressor
MLAPFTRPAWFCGIDAHRYGREQEDRLYIDGCQYRLSSMSPKRSAVLKPLPVIDELVACCPELLVQSLSEGEAALAARAFKALADPTRVRILSIIASAEGGEACVCDLTAGIDLAQPTVSHHLKVLLDAGLLERERRASWAYYRVRRDAVRDLARVLGA